MILRDTILILRSYDKHLHNRLWIQIDDNKYHFEEKINFLIFYRYEYKYGEKCVLKFTENKGEVSIGNIFL